MPSIQVCNSKSRYLRVVSCALALGLMPGRQVLGCSEWDLIRSSDDCLTHQQWDRGSFAYYSVTTNPPFPTLGFVADITQAAADWDAEAEQLTLVNVGGGTAAVTANAMYVTWADGDSIPATTLPGLIGLRMIGADLRFNFVHLDDHTYVTSGSSAGKYNFRQIALHEWGHAIGLRHVESPCADTVMDPVARGDEEIVLGQHDKAAAFVLYGSSYFTVGRVGGCTVEKTWGEVKAEYTEYRNYSRTMALSGAANTIVWNNDAATRNLPHGVYRSGWGSDVVTYLGMVNPGDSVFVDSATDVGQRYTYHIATVEDSTLIEVGTPTAGLKLVHDHLVTDGIGVGNDAALAVRGTALYGAFETTPGNFDVRKFDVSDPESPTELGRRSGLEMIHAICLSADGTRLYVQTFSGLLVLDAMQTSLPIVGELPGMVTGELDDKLSDMAVDGDVVFFACGIRGLKAIRVSPTGPVVVGTYDPDGGSTGEAVWGVDLAGDRAYVSVSELGTSTSRFERLVVTKNYGFEQVQSVAFAIECTSDDPSCWNGVTDGTTMEDRVSKGHLELAFDSNDDHPYTIVNVIDPTSPVPVRHVDAPAVGPSWIIEDESGEPIDTLSFFSTFETYDFDSRYLYATTPMFFDPFDRSLVAFDTWGSGTNLLYAGGDLLGNSLGGTVRSQGPLCQ